MTFLFILFVLVFYKDNSSEINKIPDRLQKSCGKPGMDNWDINPGKPGIEKWRLSTQDLNVQDLKFTKQNVLVNDKEKWLLCLPAKAGSTAIRKYLVAQEKLDISNFRSIYNVRQFGPNIQMLGPSQELANATQGYRRIMVVKHPWLRLFSAFKKKWTLMKHNRTMFEETYRVSQIEDPVNMVTFITALSGLRMGVRDKHFVSIPGSCLADEMNYNEYVDLSINMQDLPFNYSVTFGDYSTPPLSVYHHRNVSNGLCGVDYDWTSLWAVFHDYIDDTQIFYYEYMKVWESFIRTAAGCKPC